MLPERVGLPLAARRTRQRDLLERGQHAGLVGDAKAEGAAREGRADFSGEEEVEAMARVSTRQCSQESSGRLFVGEPTGRGGGVSSQMTNARKPGDRLQMSSGRSTWTYVSPLWKTPRA